MALDWLPDPPQKTDTSWLPDQAAPQGAAPPPSNPLSWLPDQKHDDSLRADGTKKGKGYFGPIQRPDGSVSTEISIGVNLGGKEVEIPTLVPTLSPEEKQWLITNDISDPNKIPSSIVDKAVAHARGRMAGGKSPFADDQPEKPGFLSQAWEAVKAVPDVARNLIAQPAATLGGFVEGAEEGALNVAPTVLRAGGAIGGGIVGSALGPLGTAAGGAAGAGLGDVAARMVEGRNQNWKGTAVEMALGAIPVVGKAGFVGRGLQGAVLGAGADVASSLAEKGELPHWEEVAQSALMGGAVGGTLGAAEARFTTPAGAHAPAIEPEVPPAARAPRVSAPVAPEVVAPVQEVRGVHGGAQPASVANDSPHEVHLRQPNIDPNLNQGVGDPMNAGNGVAPSRPKTPAMSVDPADLPVAEAKPERMSERRIQRIVRAFSDFDEDALPAQRPLTKERIENDATMVSKMPEHIREGVADVLEKNGHFEAQRRGVQSNERTAALADYIQTESKRVLPKGTALNAEETVAYGRAVATVNDQVDSLAAKVADGSASEVEKAQLVKAQYAQVIQTASFMGAKAETGRALNAHKQLVELFESGDMLAIAQAMKNPHLRENVEDFAKKWVTLTTDAEKLDYLRSVQKPTWMDVVKSVYYSNILSGVKTHLRNVIGNTANLGLTLATAPASVAYDAARSAVTGAERNVFAREIPHRVFGAAMGVKQGIDDALFSLQHGYTKNALATFDVPRPELAGGGKNPFNWTGRALEAEDQFFFSIAHNSELYSRLYARARGEASKAGLTGQKMGDFIENRIAEMKLNVPKDIATATTEAAKRAVFKEDPGAFVASLMGVKKSAPLLDFIIPFVKTPGNIIRQGIEMTPAAPLTKQFRTEMAKGGRESAEAMGRVLSGTVALTALAYWAASGKISGTGPTDPEERAAKMDSGWRPNSVKIGDKWVDYTTIQPLSQPLFAMASAFEMHEKTGKMPNPGEVLARAGSSMLSQSFLSGLSDLNMALTDPGRYGDSYLGRVAQGFVPFSGLSRNVAQAVDPAVRQPHGVVESMESIIPGASKNIDPKIGRFGEEINRPGDPFTRGLSPVGVSSTSKDPLIVELQRLKVENLGLPPTKLEATKHLPEVTLSIAERKEVGQATRAALEQLFAHPGFKDLDEDVARDQISRVVQRARHNVTQQLRARHRVK